NALGGNRVVTTSYGYDGNGRISSKTTSMDNGPSFTQGFEYNDLGLPKDVLFPVCSGCEGVTAGDRRTPLTWQNGFLRQVGTFTSSAPNQYISYYPNGMQHTLTHVDAAGGNAVTDTVDLESGMARPGKITVGGYCTGPQLTGALPASATVLSGDSPELTAPALSAGITATKYEWYNAGTGALLATITTSNKYKVVGITQTTSYRVRVYADGCWTDSGVATVTVKTCDQIVVHDVVASAAVVAANTPVQLTVAVDAPANLALKYEWHKVTYTVEGPSDAIVQPNGTSTLANQTLSETTGFRVRVSSTDGSCATASNTTKVRFCQPPTVAIPPASQTGLLVAGQPVTLSTFIAVKGENVTYQWYELVTNSSGQLEEDLLEGEESDTLTRTFSAVTKHTYKVKWQANTPVTGCQGGDESLPIDFTVVDCIKVTQSPGTIWVYQNTPPVQLTAEAEATYLGTPGREVVFTWYYGSGNGVAFAATRHTIQPGTNRYKSQVMAFINQPYQRYWCVVTRTDCSQISYTKKGTVVQWGTCPLPEVSINPQSVVVAAAGHATFTVACDWPRVTYQWYIGESGDTHRRIDGAAANKLTVDSTMQTYWCRVTDECGAAHRDTETVAVGYDPRTGSNGICFPPSIATQPKSVDVAAGEQPLLSIDATGAQTPEWWEVGGGLVHTGRQFLAPSVTKTYYVKLRSSCNSDFAVESALATVRVATCSSISITQHARLDVVAGNRQLSVVATSTGGTLGYTWYEGQPGDTAHPAGSGATLVVNPSVATIYWVRLSNAQCTVVDVPVLVGACAPLNIVQPTGGSIVAGQPFLLEGIGNGTGLTWKWHSGTSASGPEVGTSPGVWVYPADTTSYVLEVTDACGNRFVSTPITVYVCVTPSLVQPANVRIFGGATAGIKATAMESKQTPITYQLIEPAQFNPIGSPVTASSGQEVTLTTPVLTAETQYIVRATAGACPIDSAPVTVSMCTLPELAGNGGDQTARIGQTVHLRIGQNDLSNPDVTYTWYAGEWSVTGSPGPALKTSNDNFYELTTADPGSDAVTKYWAKLTHVDGCVSHSPTFFVRVCKPSITVPPAGGMINPNGGSMYLDVTANTPGLTYQWYVGASGNTGTLAPNGATNHFLAAPTVDTSYWVRVTGQCGFVDSDAVMVTVCKVPAVGLAAAFQPQIVRGGSTTLSVNATGTNLTYQWYAGQPGDTSAPVSGGNVAVKSVSPQDTTTYWARVSGQCGTPVNSAAVTIQVCDTPNITVPPQSTSVFDQQAAVLTVTAQATSNMPLSYQWFEGDSPITAGLINGATGTSYTTPNLSTPHNYWVRVTSGTCTPANSATATVSICPYPQTIPGPATAYTAVNQSTTLTTAANPGSNVYRWYRVVPGGSPVLIQGPNGLNSVSVSPSATTDYYATITTGTCVTTTTNTTVNVCVPTFTQQPPATKLVLSNVQYTVDALADTPGVTYQWYRGTGAGAVAVSGETTSTLHFSTTTNASYWVRATGSCGRTTDSSVMAVTLCTAPFISMGPDNATPLAPNGGSRTLTVTANGTGLTYQWYSGASGDTSQPISGATGSSLTGTVTQSTRFWVRVSGSCGNPADSAAAWISVQPNITTNLSNFSVRSGDAAPLKIVATGADLHYVWHMPDGAPLSGGTDSPYYTFNPVWVPVGAYVEVKSGTASVNSATASIDLCDGMSVSISVSGSGSCRTLTAVTEYGAETYAWYRGEVGDITSPVGTASPVSVCPAGSTKYWLRVSTTNSFTGVTCFSQTATVTVP
ncbi:MAG TPA: hypothetical protein VJ276_01705, partial [Thermoanaerobaculia bacterium]|nr:hypothetical protein [Thermoanaerobaculia bacterium]